MRPRYRWIGWTLLTLLSASPAALPAAEKDIYGWVEKVIIGPGEIELTAKLDTGADTSSLDAVDIRRVRRGAKRYVRFTVEDPESDETLTLTKPFVRRSVVKRHDGEHQRRLVVPILVCLGDVLQEIEVSLIDRSEFRYPLLLGRSALEGIAVVDPDLTFAHEPDCDMDAEPFRTVLDRGGD